MSSRLDPNAVKEVLRREHIDMLRGQIRGLAISLAVAMGLTPSDAKKDPGMVARELRREIEFEQDDFERRMARAAKKHLFLEP